MELVIALLALFVSAVTGVWTLRLNRDQLQSARLANITNIVNIERSLSDVPSALRFHGISQQCLDDAGVTADEFAYLLASCSATSLYHNFSRENPDQPFAADSYRHAMCASADFRKVWPLLKRMMNPGTFVARMDRTIALIESHRAS
jgi:hypothetical protein